MGLFKTNPFGHILWVKKWLIRILGLLTHRRFRGFNDLQIEGSEILKNLPDKNVLFISNHQTYFADVIAMFHVFNASLSGRLDSIKNVGYLWNPKLNIYYVAAKETMKSGLIPKIFAYTGSISIERTWRSKGQNVNRQVKMSDITNIKKALDDGWVITFPQGTTTPFKPIRKGTAHIIKQYQPIVVPIVIDGFRRSFDKKGLRIKKKNIYFLFKSRNQFTSYLDSLDIHLIKIDEYNIPIELEDDSCFILDNQINIYDFVNIKINNSKLLYNTQFLILNYHY